MRPLGKLFSCCHCMCPVQPHRLMGAGGSMRNSPSGTIQPAYPAGRIRFFEPARMRCRLMKRNVKAFGSACGILRGLEMFLFTWRVMLFEEAAHEVNPMGMGCRGYSICASGSLNGRVWGFFDGLIGRPVFAWLYTTGSAEKMILICLLRQLCRHNGAAATKLGGFRTLSRRRKSHVVKRTEICRPGQRPF